jgi:hypothetical protein
VTDFPRGWTLSVDGVGAAQQIVVPAIAGVAHVLDAFVAVFTNFSAAASGGLIQVSSSDGTFNNFVIGRLNTPTPAAGSQEMASASGSDLGLAAGPGASLTVKFSLGGANLAETLVIQGHDI